MLTGNRSVVHAFDRLVAHPADNRDPRVAEYHKRVMEVAHDPRELKLEDCVEGDDDALPVDLVVFVWHGVLLIWSVTLHACRSAWRVRSSASALRSPTELVQ